MSNLSLAAISPSGAVTQRITFNKTFWIEQIHSSFRQTPTPIPRADGDRMQDDGYLSGGPVVVSGYIGSGTSSGEVGTPDRTSTGGSVLGLVTDTTSAANYLAELRTAFARLVQRKTVILEYGNGWSQYVKVNQIVSQIEEGAPDLRKVTIALYAGDPKGYGPVVEGTIVGDGTSGRGRVAAYSNTLASGLAPSSNWVLKLLNTGGPTVIRVGNAAGAGMVLTLPSSQYLVIDAYRRQLYSLVAPTVPAWSRWKSGSRFWDLDPASPTNEFTFTDERLTAPIPISLTADAQLQVALKARAADWMPERVEVPATPVEASYGVAQYGVDLFG